MAYFNITNTNATTLVDKTAYAGVQEHGNISSVYISNNDSAVADIDLYLEKHSDSTKYYICKDLKIPANVSLNMTDKVSFNVKNFKLIIRANEGGSSPNLTVII